MVAELLIVVSGLPASGKTTLGRALAHSLGMPLLDKDGILEDLFDQLGCAGHEDRRRLSRASDEALLRLASGARHAVVASWWHAEPARAGLSAAAENLVEVHCTCPVEVAADRFVRRRRHPGHLDDLRTPADHLASLTEAYRRSPGPVGIGELVVVRTDREVNGDDVAEDVRAAAARLGVVLP